MMPDIVLGLRTIKPGRTSYRGFKWPPFTGEPVRVEAPDAHDRAACGGGIHFLPWGVGDTGLLGGADDIWQVVAAPADRIVDIDGAKSKAPFVDIVFEGSRTDAANYIAARAPAGVGCAFATVSGGDRSTVSGGYGSTVSGGDGSTVSGGDGSTVSGGDGSTVSGGDRSTVSGGDGSTVSGGYGSTVSGGYGSTVSGGDGSTVSGGYGSTVSGGDRSTVSGGYGSTVSGGEETAIVCKWWDAAAERYRLTVGYTGEDGIEAGKRYRVDDDGRLVPAE